MEAFNIKISVAGQELTLTILPKDNKLFKVIYYGGILGAISFNEKTETWEKVEDEGLIAGDLPLYHNDKEEERTEVELNDENMEKIGRELQKSYSF